MISALCAPDAAGIKRLRDICDRLKQKAPNCIAVLGMAEPGDEKASLVVALGPQAPQKLKAGEVVQAIAPLIEGRGGGKPDFAQAGGTKPAGLKEALEKGSQLILSKLQG